MEYECGNHARFYLLKSISRKYIQDQQNWSKCEIEKITKEVNEKQLPKVVYHYEINCENQEDSCNSKLINRFDDIIIINTTKKSSTKSLSLFHPIHNQPDCLLCYQETLLPGISSILLQSDVEERIPSIQIKDENLHAYIIINGILKSVYNENYEHFQRLKSIIKCNGKKKITTINTTVTTEKILHCSNTPSSTSSPTSSTTTSSKSIA